MNTTTIAAIITAHHPVLVKHGHNTSLLTELAALNPAHRAFRINTVDAQSTATLLEELRRHDGPALVMLEGLDQAPPEVRKPLLPLLFDRTIGGKRINNRSVVFATITDNTGWLPTPAANRCLVVEINDKHTEEN